MADRWLLMEGVSEILAIEEELERLNRRRFALAHSGLTEEEQKQLQLMLMEGVDW